MLNLPIGRLFACYQKIAVTTQMFGWTLAHGTKPVLNDFDFQETVGHIEEFEALCGACGLVVSEGAAKRASEDFRRAQQNAQDKSWYFDTGSAARADNALNQLVGCVQNEAPTKVAMLLPPEKLSLYAPTAPLFGADVRVKFASAIFDIDEAGKCLALGRSTAAVFHLMRVMEIALKAVALCLAVTPPSNPNWGSWLTAIRNENNRRTNRWADFNYFQDLWQRIDSIKDSQRNQTMHVATVYTEEEAMLIYKATEGFMKKLASRMDESGLPLA